MIFQNYWSLFAKKPTSKDSGEARKKPVMNSEMENYQGNAVVNYNEYEIPYTRIIEHKHFWTAHDEWAQYIGKTASNLAASAYRSYADGENAIDGVIETL